MIGVVVDVERLKVDSQNVSENVAQIVRTVTSTVRASKSNENGYHHRNGENCSVLS